MRLVKICGLKTAESVAAARQAGADLLGFNFYAPSPRSISPAQAAAIDQLEATFDCPSHYEGQHFSIGK